MKSTMRTFLLVAGYLILLTTGAVAQHRSFTLDQGQWVAGLSPGGGSGTAIESNSSATFDPVTGVLDSVSKVTVAGWSSLSGPTWSSDALLLEYGLSDLWSLGIKSSLVQTLGTGLVHKEWNWKLGGWATFDAGRAWLPMPGLGLALMGIAQFEPLLDNVRAAPEGLINLLSVTSVSWRVVQSRAFDLAVFTDWGYELSLPNFYLTYSWNSPASIRKTVEASGVPLVPNPKFVLTPYTSKLYLEYGTEVRCFERWSLLVSWAGTLVELRPQDPGFSRETPFSQFQESLNLAELTLKYAL